MLLQLNRRSFLWVAYAIFFCMGIPGGILNVVATDLLGTFGFGLDMLGVLLFFATLGSLIGTFFSGRMIARFGIGAFLTGGSGLMAQGLLGYTVSPAWGALLAAAFVTVLGFSILNAALNTFVASNYTTRHLNWLHAAYGVGLTLGPTLATILVEQLGQSWRVAYSIMFVVLLSVTALLALTRSQWHLQDEPGTPVSGAAAERVSIVSTLRLPAVLFGMSLFLILNGVIGGTGQLASPLLTSRGVEQAGFWVSLYWASFTVGRIIMGFFANRIDNYRLLRACIIGAIFGAALLWQNASSLLNLLGLGLIGLSCAPIYPTMIAVTRNAVALRHRANAIGFQLASSGIGSSLVPGALAWLAEHTSLAVIGVFPLAGLLIGLAIYELSLRYRRAAAAI